MINYEIKIKGDKEVAMKEEKELQAVVSSYTPTEEERKVLGMVRDDFSDAYVGMYKPRREFNDLSLIDRIDRDQMAWNTYQVNDGDGYEEDISDAWRSRAMRPVVRNKCVSIAAHTTARLMFPKVFAYNKQSDEQKDAAQVMRDLIEWSADQSNYIQTSLFSTISALVNPVSYTYTEYSEVYKRIKSVRGEDGKWQWEEVLDEDRSGFKDVVVSPDQLFIGNFYEYNIQNQPYLIWRRVQSYDLIKQKYGHLDNFKYVQKGVRVFYNDANDTFYDVYDDEMEDNLCEEILYWNKSEDLFLKIVNGVLLCEADNPNPRKDKLYPFATTGYELVDGGKFFYYKSLAFRLKQDADIINTLYPMIIDGTYLSIMPPGINSGDANIDSSVYIPGAITPLDEGNEIKQLMPNHDLNAGIGVLNEVERSLTESSEIPVGEQVQKSKTAYADALREKEKQTTLGLFIQMRSDWVNQYNRLRMGDIIQYLTIGEVDKILDNTPLIYRTFILPERQSDGKSKTRKIDFDAELKDEMTDDEYRKESYKLLDEGGEDVEICKVNPILFRELKYILKSSPDVINPISEELERAYGIEGFDRAIQAAQVGVRVDLEKTYKDFILHYNPQSKNNPDEYLLEEKPLDIMNVVGAKKEGMMPPSEKALKQQPPVNVGV
jgi:hypothetical protein